MATENVRPKQSLVQFWTVTVLATLIIVGCLLGFAEKFIQLVKIVWGDPDGVFALTPIMNYLLASFGFLFLFGWAAANGMFRDIEGPKYTMLEREQQLDESEHYNSRTICEERKR